MSFHDLVFPENLSFGTRGGAGFATSVIPSDSGMEKRASHWENQKSRIQYDVAKSVQTESDIATLLDFYLCVRGSACGFRFKDPTDFSSAPDGTTTPSTVLHAQQAKAIAPDANGYTRKFQLHKKYDDLDYGENYLGVLREITKPIAPGQAGHKIQVYVGGALGWESTDAGVGVAPTVESDGLTTVAIDYDLGTIILDAPQQYVSVGFTFHVPARFGQEVDDGLNISWQTGGTYQVDTLPIVEISGRGDNASEEWLSGGHTSQSIPAAWHDQFRGDLTRQGTVQKYTTYDYKQRNMYLENLRIGSTVPRSRQTPLTNGEYFTGGPFVLVYNSSSSSHLLMIGTYDAGGNRTASIWSLSPGYYVQLYWLGNSLGYVAK
jgi:uncharacterized protein (TIGR02217 family)